MALLGATGHTYAVALRLQAQSIVPATSEMYAVCASRCVSQQIVPVAPCDSAKGFVFAEGSATKSVQCIHCSRTPLIRPPSESHWGGRIRGMVAREGFVYEQKPLSVT